MNAPQPWAQIEAQATDAEQHVLGACLVMPTAIDAARDVLSPEDFAEPIHRRLFDMLADARAAGRSPDVALLCAALGAGAEAEIAPGMNVAAYVQRLLRAAPAAPSVKDYIEHLRDCADRRRLFLAGQLLTERAAAGRPAGTPREIAIDVMSTLDAVAAARMADHLRRVSAGEAANDVLARMERARAGDRDLEGTPYGVPMLDRMTLGMHAGHLTIVAARPSMGKTAFGLSASLSAARAGHAVLFMSLEMPASELTERALSCLSYEHGSPIPYTSIRSGDLGDDQARRLHAAGRAFSRYPITIEQQRGLSPSQIVARARSEAQRLARIGQRLGLVVVDHLGKVRPSDRYAGNRTTELGEITGALKDMSGELDCSVMLLCQLNRQTEQRDNKRPTLGDLRESGRIEEDADNVLMLYRPAYYEERTKEPGEKVLDRMARIGAVKHDMEIIVAKQRQGETGMVDAWCDMACNVISGRSAS